MHTLTWNHSREGTPMRQTGTFGMLMLRVWMVRQVVPDHPMFLDGKLV